MRFTFDRVGVGLIQSVDPEQALTQKRPSKREFLLPACLPAGTLGFFFPALRLNLKDRLSWVPSWQTADPGTSQPP